ncbi:MAG TPA: site-specific integrase [Candidatus Rothia avicola]|uniref:Site-specific integrase n=1 Tax=Candidatus Rothia avicola TaxID=2840478 RepID=A0A9D2CRB4_9MICC|nr:site-specific integrase [Candidatus Rothia avicola]
MESVDALLEEYLASYTVQSTIQNKRRYILPLLQKLASARLPFSEVTAAFIDQHIIDEARGKGWKESTTASARNELQRFVSYAYKRGLLAEELELRLYAKTRPRAVQYFYSVEECQRILEACKRAPRHVALAIHLALFNGLRRSDILSAHMDYIRHDGQRVLLHLPLRKGGTSSTVVLPQVTVDLLPASGKLVPCSYFVLKKEMLKIEREAQLIAHPLILHSLRATFITQALDAGVSERDVMLAAGHKRLTTTAYYDQGYKTARVGVSDAVVSRLQA